MRINFSLVWKNSHLAPTLWERDFSSSRRRRRFLHPSSSSASLAHLFFLYRRLSAHASSTRSPPPWTTPHHLFTHSTDLHSLQLLLQNHLTVLYSFLTVCVWDQEELEEVRCQIHQLCDEQVKSEQSSSNTGEQSDRYTHLEFLHQLYYNFQVFAACYRRKCEPMAVCCEFRSNSLVGVKLMLLVCLLSSCWNILLLKKRK